MKNFNKEDNKAMKGKVRWFDPQKGFGFIYSEELGGDVFVHISEISKNGNGLKTLGKNDVVEFETFTSPKGLKAIKVKKEESNETNRSEQSNQ